MFNIKRESDKDVVKESFERVKEDIFNLSNEILGIRSEILHIKETLKLFDNELTSFKLKNQDSLGSYPRSFSSLSDNSRDFSKQSPTQRPFFQSQNNTPTQNPTVPSEIGGLKYPNLDTSIGNEGVPTDKPTNQQTDNPTHFYAQSGLNPAKSSSKEDSRTLKQHILDATEILNSLDTLRKEVRLKFKAITNQEMLVFSTIYELEQLYVEGVEYEQIASKLKLSPSSIRDYVHRLINKGVPILKNKVNNKKILLSISQELKKIASLDTIIKLREL